MKAKGVQQSSCTGHLVSTIFFKAFAAIALIAGLSLTVTAQEEFEWWNKLHDCSIYTEEGWQAWMFVSPGYLGINALPIPSQLKGEIKNKAEFEIATDAHFLSGETAQNLFVRYFQPFAEGRIAIEIFGVPIEHFKHTEAIRDERRSRVKSGEGWGMGDIFFATHIKLFDREHWPSAVVRMACKTAIGDLAGARFTDSPAYWFDLSAGQTFGTGNLKARPFAMAGFYVWQMTGEWPLQNDAKLWGGGIEITYKKFSLEQSVQGYSGWLTTIEQESQGHVDWKEKRDRPVNYRISLRRETSNGEIKLSYQHGLRDVLYRSLRIGYTFRIGG